MVGHLVRPRHSRASTEVQGRAGDQSVPGVCKHCHNTILRFRSAMHVCRQNLVGMRKVLAYMAVWQTSSGGTPCVKSFQQGSIGEGCS